MYRAVFAPVRREFLARVLCDAANTTAWADVMLDVRLSKGDNPLFSVAHVKSHGFGGTSTRVDLASINLVLARLQNGDRSLDKHFSPADIQRICTADAFNDHAALENDLGAAIFQIAALGTIEFLDY